MKIVIITTPHTQAVDQQEAQQRKTSTLVQVNFEMFHLQAISMALQSAQVTAMMLFGR